MGYVCTLASQSGVEMLVNGQELNLNKSRHAKAWAGITRASARRLKGTVQYNSSAGTNAKGVEERTGGEEEETCHRRVSLLPALRMMLGSRWEEVD